MKIQDATLLVTGANRGLGLPFARAALERGARRVYAGARKPEGVKLPGLTPEAVAARAFDALEAGDRELMADETSRPVKARRSAQAAPYLVLSGD